MSDWRSCIGDGPNRARIIRFLEAAEQMDCRIEIPEGERGDYVNVRPPSASSRRGRLASVHISTGSVEFQTDSWTRLGAPSGFRHLAAGNKAARHLTTGDDLDALTVALSREASSGT